MKKKADAPKFCFVCCKNLEKRHCQCVGDEVVCGPCYVDYKKWAEDGFALYSFRSASMRTNKHLADLRTV